MRASRPRDNNSHCFHCYLRREICICPILPTVQTRAKFLILRHIHETERPSNTGRLVALALPNSQIVPFGGGARGRFSSFDDELLQSPGTLLLWPDGTGIRSDIPDIAPPSQVVVLDATWRQARRLYIRMPILQAIPRLVQPVPPRCRNRLREQHRSDGMSTIEAVAAAVTKLEGPDVAMLLEKLYDEVVRRTIALRWGVNRSHRDMG